METVRLFVGFDPDEALAFHVFSHSVHRRASLPVSIQPVMRSQLGFFARTRGPLESTDFAITRFLVPFLCGYEGWALFADGDMLCRADVAGLWALRDRSFAVQVVKRESQTLGSATKFLDRPQLWYPRKNWSSVMLFNCGACRQLTPELVAEVPGLYLHGFEWLADDDIGELPGAWNHLVSVDPPEPEAQLIHYTLGMPFFHGYAECEFAREWRAEREAMMAYLGAGDEGTLFRARMAASER